MTAVICDVSRGRNELDLSKYKFDLILEEIKTVLSEKDFDAEELVKLLICFWATYLVDKVNY